MAGRGVVVLSALVVVLYTGLLVFSVLFAVGFPAAFRRRQDDPDLLFWKAANWTQVLACLAVEAYFLAYIVSYLRSKDNPKVRKIAVPAQMDMC